MMKMTMRYFLLLLTIGLLSGCSQADPNILPTAAATKTAIPSATPEPAAPTATATPITAPPTSTAIPTSTPLPAETLPPDTEPTEPPAAPTTAPAQGSAGAATPSPAATAQAGSSGTAGGVSQPPYEKSSCSDKYPCNNDRAGWEKRIQVPAGFTATYFAHLPGLNPTGLAFGPDNQLYVATQQGTIYRINDRGQASAYVSGLIAPTGIEFRPGTSQLFVSSRVVEANVGGEGQVSVIENGGIRRLIGGLPCCYAFMHGPHDIVFDSRGNGYLGVGARADHGEVIGETGVQDTLDPLEAAILRFNPDTGATEKYADGLRNPFGLAIDANGVIYATDNAPDYGPPDEFHRVVPGGQHGYPWYDCDICFKAPEGVSVIPPTYNFPPHVSPTGATVYLGGQFPNAFNHIFVTLWSAFPGAQKVVRFGPNGVGYSNFATGFAAPIDVATDPSGNLYVADWATGIIFKISYTG